MRLIDADALKRKAQRVATEAWKTKITGKVETILNQFIDWINNAPTIEPEQNVGKWISVKERLPEKSGWYITTEITKDNFKYVREMWFSVCGGWRYYDPIAWMMLPEPYQEEGEN